MYPMVMLMVFLAILIVAISYFWLTNQMFKAIWQLMSLSVLLLCCQIVSIGMSRWFSLSESSVISIMLSLCLFIWGGFAIKAPTRSIPEKRWFMPTVVIVSCFQAMEVIYIFLYDLNYSQTLVLFVIGGYFLVIAFSVIWVYLYQVYYKEQRYLLLEATSNSEELVNLLVHESEQNELYLNQMLHANASQEKTQLWQQLKQDVRASRLPLYSDDLTVTVAIHQAQHEHANTWIDTQQWQMPVYDQALFVRLLLEILTFTEERSTLCLQLTPLTQRRLMIGCVQGNTKIALLQALSAQRCFEIYKYIQTDQKRLKVNVLFYLMAHYRLKGRLQVLNNETFYCIEQFS